MNLINETNLSAGTYYEVIQVANLANVAFQYKIIVVDDNEIELQFFGTTETDADETTDDDWVNITEFLTEEVELIIEKDATLNDISITDSQCPFAKIKVKYIVTTDTPNNSIKVGWNSNK